MLSRWALKHVFRFILKKKLGKIILGDLDLDQLDVQLGAGSIELHDLALNVEYLNQKLGMNPIMVKDGSIGSLSVKIPWNVSNCEVEIKDLEIVLSQQSVEEVPGAVEHMRSHRVEKPSISGSRVKISDSRIHQDATFTPSDVHEGVKTIANLVKCLLSNFHVKVNNLLVALDPNPKKAGKTSHIYRIMVFHITELAYGTCLSESVQTHSDSGSQSDGFLGMTKLTNFVTFHGATVELLQVIDEESQSDFSDASGFGISQSCKPFVPPIPVFTGENGLCGTLKLSMPWKNGSLDISKVDAEFHIDPVELRFYPSSIQFIIFLWDSFKFIGRNDNGSTNCKAVGSETGLSDRLVTNMNSHIGVETLPNESIPGTRLILDWVPVGIIKDKNAGAEVEPDFGASVNQFFDCLDGISSQSALSSSGIWNWTCSVFSTISAASSLASGSLHIPTEQQHVQTNINATIAGVSIILSFHDETQNGCNGMKSSGENMYVNNMNSDVESLHLEQKNMLPDQKTCFYSSVHYLEANLQGLNVIFQIFPQQVKFEAVLKQIMVNDCFKFEGKATDSGLLVNGDELFREVNLVHSLQSEIQGALPPFPFSFEDPPDMLKNVSRSDTVVANLHLEPVDTKVQGDDHRPIARAKYVKMNILRTSTSSEHLISVISRHANGKLRASTSFFAHLPPTIMWVNLNTVNMLLDLCNQIRKTAVPNFGGTSDASSHGRQDRKGFDQTSEDMANPTVVSVQGNIVLAETRTIVCFPLQRYGDSRSLYFHNNFAVFDLCPSERTDSAGETFHVQNGCSGGSSNYMPSTSIHLNIGSFSVYLISKPDRNTSEGNLFVYNEQSFSAKEIFSSIAGSCGKCSGVFMIWNVDAVTDMRIAKRAWDMATSRNFSRNKDSRKKCEYASVATVSDQEGISSQVHQELISASGFSFRVHFARAIVSLGHTEYALLVHLISQVLGVFSNGGSAKNDVNTREDFSKDKLQSHDVKFSQSSFLLECDVLDISVKLEEALDVNTSIQKELPGSWASTCLTVQNFELLSGSNIGGMPSSSILWVSHGEGELWGSIVKTAGEVAGTSEDIMLVCARNSAMRRGDGGGANALSSGFAGTSIVHLSYPDMQMSTSITLKCGTLVAPGGRLDWLAALSSFFCVPAGDGACSSDADRQKKFSQKEKVYESSFFLELVDVALSYEPYQKGVKAGKEGLKSACPDPMKCTGKIGEQGVACLLAAASLYVSSRNSDGATSSDYKIGIQDIGLLLSDLPALWNLVDYDVRHLRANNYVKVAGETLVEVILETDSDDGTWQLTCSGCHVKINTCHDTMAGLICLGNQLQQLFAPDLTESVLHLQTRWNIVMQANNDRDETKAFGGDTSKSPLIVQVTDEDNNSSPLGLMDEILDDVFREEAAQSLGPSESLSNHPPSSETVSDNKCFLHTSKNGNAPLNASSNLLHQPEQGNLSKPSPNCLPEFIDDYYVLDTFSAQNPGGYHKHSDAGPSSRATGSANNVDNGKSGWYEDGSFCIVENHVPIVNHHEGCIDSASSEYSFSSFASVAEELKSKGRIILENVNVTWAMFAGSDWSSSSCNGSEVSKTIGRDTAKCLELSLLGMNIKYDIFPNGKLNVSNLSISIQDVHVYDSSKEAPWKMILGYYHSKLHPRESHAKAVDLILETVKPDPLIPLEEYRLKLSLLPLRLHLHQSQVDFLVSFFSHGHPSSDQFSSVPNDLGRPCTFATSVSQLNVVEEALLPFFQKCDIYPSILRVDYIPQHVDLAALGGGNYVELLNLVPWKGIELRLKYVHAAGIYGWNSVCETVIGEWLEDISHNQVRELIKGLVPVRSLCSVGSGAAKLISLPVTNYRKDHKLLKGLQRGAITFLRSVSLEAVALGVHLAGGAHDMLLQTEYILQNVPPSVHTASRDREDAAVRVNQPNNAQEGVQQAYKTLAHGFGKSASALVGNPMKSYNRGASAGSALASAAKSAPAAAVAPATAAVGAIHCALLGVRNSLDPERKRESMEKYSGPSSLHHKPMR
ncbi:autophagy-related protein 2 isoform X1 [Nymphaea colorata]|nr:autophagy-related protein 2 isoform X1 [Nymphaea colorata]